MKAEPTKDEYVLCTDDLKSMNRKIKTARKIAKQDLINRTLNSPEETAILRRECERSETEPVAEFEIELIKNHLILTPEKLKIVRQAARNLFKKAQKHCENCTDSVEAETKIQNAAHEIKQEQVRKLIVAIEEDRHLTLATTNLSPEFKEMQNIVHEYVNKIYDEVKKIIKKNFPDCSEQKKV